MIEGVRVRPLRQIVDERGKIMHFLTSDDEEFTQFGEVYFSTIHPGVVKAWHQHKLMTLNYVAPVGQIKFVLYDPRTSSSTYGEIVELFLGPDNYCLVSVPPMIWNGFKGIGTDTSLVANCSSIRHNPDEINRLDPFENDIPYDWSIKHY
jgi:dTDP-4-dehydrorhamnose 3,5-epimerase